MSDPCTQERSIGSLEATTEAIQQTLGKLEQGQEKFISILESIAAQGTRIGKLEKDTGEMFSRIRAVELDSNSHNVKIGVAGTLLGAISGTIAAFFVKHFGGGH